MVNHKGIYDAWRILIRKKVVQRKTVYNQIRPDDLSREKMEDSEVQRQIEENGYYEVAHELPADLINALEYLIELGYVEKRVDRIFDIGWHYIAHPYLPHIFVSGGVGITSKSTMPYESFTLNSSQFEAFERTAKEFKSQVDAGMHPHITRFIYGVKLSYETEVYELRDSYFDALYIRYNSAEDRLIVELVEPFVETRNGKVEKKWTQIERVSTDTFLEGSTKIDPLLETLEWKKDVLGIVIFNKRAYWLLPSDIMPEMEDDEDSPFKMPNYFEGDGFSYQNYMSRTFEDATADYLRQEHSYDTYTRIKPDYLENKEIDVFGRRVGVPQNITVCECKLRFNDSPITMTEITTFYEKILGIKENVGKEVDTRFYFWFVTNTEIFEEGVKEYAENVGIDIMKAELSTNWKRRAHWKINRLRKYE